MNQPIRILLIDDSPHFIEAAHDFLDFHEMLKVVGTATSRNEAITQFDQMLPDVILLDLNLAGTSGLSLIPHFRMNLSAVRIIVLTSMEETAFRSAALESGADDFISKKFMTSTLVASIREQIEQTPKPRNTGDHASTQTSEP